MFVKPVLVALLHQLMRATYQVETVYIVKFAHHLATKKPTGATRRYGPRVYVFGIGPDEVAEGALVGYFLVAFDDAYLIECLDFGRETAVYAQNRAVNDCRYLYLIFLNNRFRLADH